IKQYSANTLAIGTGFSSFNSNEAILTVNIIDLAQPHRPFCHGIFNILTKKMDDGTSTIWFSDNINALWRSLLIVPKLHCHKTHVYLGRVDRIIINGLNILA